MSKGRLPCPATLSVAAQFGLLARFCLTSRVLPIPFANGDLVSAKTPLAVSRRRDPRLKIGRGSCGEGHAKHRVSKRSLPRIRPFYNDDNVRVL